MRIAVTGAHGFIARHLLTALRAEGHETVPIVRGPARAGEVHWDPSRGDLETTDLEGLDAVVNLAGAGIASRRWTEGYKQVLLDSRVLGTRLLASRLAELARAGEGPGVLISASAVGYYGNRRDEELDETSSPGDDFLAKLCQSWEAATEPAAEAGVRTVRLRSGIVLGADGGALRAQLLPFKLGLGARLGDGRQWTSWISVDDEVGALRHCLERDDLSGPVNAVAPNPVTNAELTRTLARVLGRPAVLVIPAVALELALGREMAQETLLASQRVRPGALLGSGYRFGHPLLETALRAVLGLRASAAG